MFGAVATYRSDTNRRYGKVSRSVAEPLSSSAGLSVGRLVNGTTMKKTLGIILFGVVVGTGACAGPSSQPVRVAESPSYEGPILDPHIHVFFDEEVAAGVHKSNPVNPAGVEALLDDSRIQAGLMVMATGSLEQAVEDNDRVIEFAAKIPGSFAIGSVNPNHGDAAVTELDRMVKAGVRWLKLHPNSQRFDVAAPTVAKIVKRSGELGVPVTFDASLLLDADQIGKFIRLAIANPSADIVLAHMGGPRFDELSFLKALEMYPWWKRNIWLDISFTVPLYAGSPRKESLVWTLRTVGIDRVLFASDYPAHTPAETIEAVETLGLNAAEQRAVFYGNTRQLLDKEATARNIRNAP